MSASTPGWQKWDPIGTALSDINSDKLTAVADGLADVVTILQGVAEALAIAEGFLAQDPLTAALSTVGNLYAGLMNGLEQTDIYALPMLPHSWADLFHPYTINDAIIDVQSALADRQDPNRPLFGPNDRFASVTILVGADNWTDFRKFLKILGSLFSDYQASKWARFADLRLEFDRYRRSTIPRPERGSQGETWDWYKTSWIELIPPLGEALRKLRDLVDGLVGVGMGLGQTFNDLLEVLEDRINYIRQVVTEVARIAEFLANLRDLAPYSSLLFITSPDGGTQEFVRAMESAGNRPEYKLVGGLTLFAATANPASYFDTLKYLLGMQATSAQAAFGQAAEAVQQ